jgi:hypothetical protein
MPDTTFPIPTPRTDVIEGYTLSVPPAIDFAECEEEFQRLHNAKILGAVDPDDAGAYRQALQFCSDHAELREFAYNAPKFNRRCFDLPVAPFLAYLSLRVKHPTMTRQQARALITDQNLASVRVAVLELLGFPMSKPPTEGAPKNGEAAPTPPGGAGADGGNTAAKA